jgi:signal transduction histidine kinase
LYAYETSKRWKWLQRSHIPQSDIDEWCGIHVYRDGIRILPYGEKGDDWLELDKRSVQLPAGMTISNDTIIGMVEINQLENSLLKDKTNREGLIENAAFHQFKALVFSAIRVLETERMDDRPESKQRWNVSKLIDELEEHLSGTVTQLSESSYENASQVIDSLENVIRQLRRVDEEISQTIEEQKQEGKLLFNLAGTGLAAERFTHEFARLVRGANDALRRLKKLINWEKPKVKKEVDIIYESLEALRNDIRLLGPMFYVKKVANEKDLDIRQIIQNTLYLQEHWLKKESIHVELLGETFSVKMREGSCMQIFNNLIDNSIFWLSRKSEVDKRKIRIILDDWLSTVFVSDSGSGVIPRYNDKVFEPFFSTKTEDGRGLGLYIAKEILEEKNWKIELISQEDYPELELLQGASFKITFSENQDE